VSTPLPSASGRREAVFLRERIREEEGGDSQGRGREGEIKKKAQRRPSCVPALLHPLHPILE
jgi:hypothetical protein